MPRQLVQTQLDLADYAPIAHGLERIGRGDLIPALDRHAQRNIGVRLLDSASGELVVHADAEQVRTLDAIISRAERADKASSAISSVSTLREAIALAKGGGDDFRPARRLIVKRATELGEDALALVPRDWVTTWKSASDGRHGSSPAKPSAADAAAEASQWGGGVQPTVLDDAGAGTSDGTVELNRVALDPSFPEASFKFDGVAKQARYERAAKASRLYGANRALFESDDALYRAGNRDLVAQLEQETAAVRASQQAKAANAPQDRAAGFEAALRSRGVPDPKVGVPEAHGLEPAPPVKLDAPPAPDKPLRFVELIDAPDGMRLMEAAGGLYTEGKAKSLDEATAIVTGAGPAASVGRPPAAALERHELDETVKRWQAKTGDGYLKALEAVCAATLPGL